MSPVLVMSRRQWLVHVKNRVITKIIIIHLATLALCVRLSHTYLFVQNFFPWWNHLRCKESYFCSFSELNITFVVTLTFYACNHVCLIIKYYDRRISCVLTQQTNATTHTYISSMTMFMPQYNKGMWHTYHPSK